MSNIFENKIKNIERILKEKSKIDNKTEKNFKCKKCKDQGIYISNGLAYTCPCMKQKSIYRKYKNANLGEEIQKCKFDSFSLNYYPDYITNSKSNISYYEEAKITLNACKDFVRKVLKNQVTKGLCICGPVGTGKTFLAASIANTLIAYNRQVLFTVVPDLLEDLRIEYLKSSESINNQYLNTLTKTIPILILDDLGAHNYTDWTINKLYTIINHRINDNLPVIITTNLDINILEEKLGERIVSRLLQLCQIYSLSTETDIRLQNFNILNNSK